MDRSDGNRDLNAVTNRLAAQTDQLQGHLQQQLNLNANAQGRNMFASRPAGLASLGEDAEAAPESLNSSQSQSAFNRQGGPRFAGNAAFQSAVARHSNQPNNGNYSASSADFRANLAHQRQLSLQSRFADLGYNVSSGLGPTPSEADDMTDDGASSVGYGASAFDPTRAQRGHVSDFSFSSSGTGAHRRTGSDMSGMLPSRGGNPSAASGAANANPNSLSAQSQMLAEQQVALQQQIEMLQLQQQQLMQSANNPAAGAGNTFNGSNHSFGGHRRIQSHAPRSGPMGSFSTGNTFNSGLNSFVPAQAATQNSNLPQGHGRRHSVNVLNKANQQQQQQQQQSQQRSSPNAEAMQSSGPAMQANPNFSFPSTASAQRTAQAAYQPTHLTSGHFSRPSAQLTDLSSDYLMAGGGLVSLNGFGMGGSMNDLADGFGGAGAGGPRGSHARGSSTQWRMNSVQQPQLVDLAQAQAHLAMLHQFRESAAVTGHYRAPSVGGAFNPMAGGFGGNQFGGIGGPANGPGATQRKALFGNYLPQGTLPTLLAHGKIVVGVLRINKRNRSDAYVTTEVLDGDIFISGSKDRNRALEGDLVAVELLDPLEVWSIKKEKEDKKKRKEEQNGQISRKPDKAKDDLEVEGAQLRLIEDEEENEESPPQLAGHVVAIVERSPGQLFSGTLGLLRPSSAATKEKQQAERAQREGPGALAPEIKPRPKIIWFRPTDKRVPLIAIPADQAPEDFWADEGQESFNSRLFVACIKRWPITSLHPFGALVEEIGVIGNVEAETQALLKDTLSSATEAFSEGALKCLPPTPWKIPEKEYETRKDYRSHRVFTIDPETARDLDDALHVVRLDDGNFEVGVHIADVSHFVKLGSSLDREARKRGTSVYLVQRAIPMLPPTLSEELCSLVPGVERLTFSAVFTMNKDAQVIKSWFGKSIIDSCAKLAYADAQKVIEGGELPKDKIKAHQPKDIADDILILHELAQKMRARRFDAGALRIDNVKLSFKLDENGLPTDATIYSSYDAHRLIEEFMLQANMAVAQQIAFGLPELALLRRHEKPLDRRLEGFLRRAKSMGYDIDVSSGGALHRSLKAIEDESARQALQALVTNSMMKAKYFCTGMVDIAKYHHYALNVPLYTHFTSPIRRYADLMVHRQLEAVLAEQDKFPVDREAMAKIAQQCNVKKDAAKLAQEQSAHLFLCLLVHDLTMRYGPVVRTATVMGVLDAAFDVIVPDFGIEKRVHVDQMPIENHTYDEDRNALSIYWKDNVDVIAWLAETSDDVHVKKLQEVAQQHQMMEMTSQSQTDEAALFADEDDDEHSTSAIIRQHNVEAARESQQRNKSLNKTALQFDGVQENAAGGHKIQTIRELMHVPVIVTSDMTKSPPVLKVFSVNPFASTSNH
ncbi:Nucleic acid-binding, OB-fold [Kalmanozyma brasiliensis GHG001]|uniref:DIS3-like exonuclease 2 n=1 Tax=Kalmanozyma brasiliensis (strain GHG001) TaxID=1365824 RepID=V5GJQ2_KALBG|nr:Nucleic acid-binding, OB-fold [Kalmanozyma brasiliensis GHG001]EST06187.1 Nucleic acid-binding, OB-fold [Kalmanozyma brasiliensis GHG001]